MNCADQNESDQTFVSITVNYSRGFCRLSAGGSPHMSTIGSFNGKHMFALYK